MEKRTFRVGIKREIISNSAIGAYLILGSVGDVCSYLVAQGRRIPYFLRGIPTEVVQVSTPEGLTDFGYVTRPLSRQ